MDTKGERGGVGGIGRLGSTHIHFFFFQNFLKNKFIYFIFGCVESLLLRAGFLQLQQAGSTLRCGAGASHCGGFSWCGVQALGAQAQQLWLVGSRAQAQQLWCTSLVAPWHVDLPRPGLEPVSPALAGGFPTTVLPGKSRHIHTIDTMYKIDN